MIEKATERKEEETGEEKKRKLGKKLIFFKVWPFIS
jgi:hypothetical protein